MKPSINNCKFYKILTLDITEELFVTTAVVILEKKNFYLF